MKAEGFRIRVVSGFEVQALSHSVWGSGSRKTPFNAVGNCYRSGSRETRGERLARELNPNFHTQPLTAIPHPKPQL